VHSLFEGLLISNVTSSEWKNQKTNKRVRQTDHACL